MKMKMKMMRCLRVSPIKRILDDDDDDYDYYLILISNHLRPYVMFMLIIFPVHRNSEILRWKSFQISEYESCFLFLFLYKNHDISMKLSSSQYNIQFNCQKQSWHWYWKFNHQVTFFPPVAWSRKGQLENTIY